jgi:hypothetical protein
MTGPEFVRRITMKPDSGRLEITVGSLGVITGAISLILFLLGDRSAVLIVIAGLSVIVAILLAVSGARRLRSTRAKVDARRWNSVRGLLGLAVAALAIGLGSWAMRAFGPAPWDSVGAFVWIPAMIVFWVTIGRLAWVNSGLDRRRKRDE